MLYEFIGGKFLSIIKWFRANFANNWTIVMNPRNMLTQIIFRSNRFPVFARMTAFLVNCKLSSRKISKWCDVTKPITRSISGLMFFWWGVLVRLGKYTDLMVQLRCRWLTDEPWLQSLVCPSAGVWLYLWLFSVQKYILTNSGVIHEGIEGF